MAYFKEKGQFTKEQSQGLKAYVIKNSATVKSGMAVKATGGYLEPAGAGDKILGVIKGIVSRDGLALNVAHATAFDGAYTSGGDGVETYVATADNQTDKQVKALISLDPDTLWANDSSGDLTAANLFQFFDLLAGGLQVNAASASALSGSVQLVGLDPDGDGDASKGVFKIAESQLSPAAQAAAA